MFKITRTATLILFLPAFGLADVPDQQQAEVQHLIAYVKDSPCRINRNGTWYAGKKAAEHIKRKYNYFRGEMSSTEDFIQLSATQSSWSGREYRVQCDGQGTETSRQWLLRELTKYRRTKNLPSP